MFLKLVIFIYSFNDDGSTVFSCSVGAALLRGEFSSAVRMILGGKEGERPEVAEARAAYLRDGDAKVRKGEWQIQA